MQVLADLREKLAPFYSARATSISGCRKSSQPGHINCRLNVAQSIMSIMLVEAIRWRNRVKPTCWSPIGSWHDNTIGRVHARRLDQAKHISARITIYVCQISRFEIENACRRSVSSKLSELYPMKTAGDQDRSLSAIAHIAS
jgi:hypothetical protein